METLSHIASPSDSRCNWLQLVADEAAVLAADPSKIDGAATLPGTKQRRGADSELPAWTILFDIEANHHWKNRGWTHVLGIVAPKGEGLALYWMKPTAATKAAIKAAGAAHLIGGSGPNAAMVRAARYILEGADDNERQARLAAVNATAE